MRLELPGRACPFRELPNGAFFQFLKSGSAGFGICVSIGERKAAIVLAAPGKDDTPFFVDSPLLNDPIVHIPEAILRAHPHQIAAGTGDFGSVISVSSNFYIRCKWEQDTSHVQTFNLIEGVAETIRETSRAVHYPTWEVGLIIDQEFFQLFSFPSKVTVITL